MRLLILGTGGRAHRHAMEFSKIEGVEIVGAVDMDVARVKTYAAKYNIPNTFTKLDEALHWGKFDAAANVTPDKAHYPTTLALVAGGKHVFCEKPLAETYEQAAEMASATENAKVVGMVALNFRELAALQKAREIVTSGGIGRLRHLDASFLQSWLVSNAYGHWASEPRFLWRLSKKHGSNGVLGDLGIHILDCAAYAAGSSAERIFARLKCFEKAPGNRIGGYDLDANDSFAMTVELKNGAIGLIQASRWTTGFINELRLRLFGDTGALDMVYTDNGTSLRACVGEDVHKAIWREVSVDKVTTNHQRFTDAVQTGQIAEPDFRYAADLQRMVDVAIRSEDQRCELRMSVREQICR
ncbi:Gfo/Idh/MocA family oxidoreductase [Sinorhizobium meliloti]|uniref:Gfo/Idh/MocA family protein n=1 Tax=Rhizobium meliloti TaxID=382 RepID=UPI000364C868|nr:Gfo/Idh/MocA family oxidoreductase [Sinorhizobium meliloti]MDE3759805.1 Gfo/Idh/MocA family oxidoreductase [Sinorhizobium meliloti]